MIQQIQRLQMSVQHAVVTHIKEVCVCFLSVCMSVCSIHILSTLNLHTTQLSKSTVPIAHNCYQTKNVQKLVLYRVVQ